MDSQPALVPQWLKEGSRTVSTASSKTSSSPTSENLHLSSDYFQFDDRKPNGLLEEGCEREISQKNYRRILSRTRSFAQQDIGIRNKEVIPANGSNSLVRSISVNSGYSQPETVKWGSTRTDFKQTLQSKHIEQKPVYKGDEGELIEKAIRQRTKLLIPRVKQSNRVKSTASSNQSKQRQTGPIALKLVNSNSVHPSDAGNNFGLILKKKDIETPGSNASQRSPTRKPTSDSTANNTQNTKLVDRQNFFNNLKNITQIAKCKEQGQGGENGGNAFTDRELQFLHVMGWKKGDWENSAPLSEEEIAEFRASQGYKLYVNKLEAIQGVNK
eukprot:TRINITY_DN283_c0_g1_i7.p1 TRINITY_DN283_c0_g1~~TRINITY_DN283_c0_g1_i7.p1  ORF type:complete len:328 (-),score=43.67 TRINITY_DN283_c0_g1_i7:293-1276(-)